MKILLGEEFKKKTKKEQEEFKKNIVDVLELHPNGFWRKMLFTKPNGDKINLTNSIQQSNKKHV